jgi:hypothetical protein
MQFHVLRPYRNELFGDHFAHAEVLDPQHVGETDDTDHCPRCGQGIGALEWLPPQRMKLSSTQYPDLLWGAGFDLMVSSRFRGLYEAVGLQGIKRFDPPAEIVKVGKLPVDQVQPTPPPYYNIYYLHGGAQLDSRRSGARRPRGLCLYCRPGIDAVERVILQPDSWTGADIFEAYGLPGDILVTQRFKALVDEHGITNAELIPAEQYRFNRYTNG